MSPAPEKQAPTIAQDAIPGGQSTDSTSAAERREAFLQQAQEILQLPDPDLFWAIDQLARDSYLKPIRGAAQLKVLLYVIRMTAGFHRWRVAEVGLTDIARAVGCTDRGASAGLRRLEELGFIYVDRPEDYGTGTRSGVTITLLMPEARKRRRRNASAPRLSTQPKMDVNPEWLEEELGAAGTLLGCDMQSVADFCLWAQRQEGLLDSEMVLWIRSAAAQTSSVSLTKPPPGYFRNCLLGMLRGRHGGRTPTEPVTNGGTPQHLSDEAFDAIMGASA